MLRFFITGVGGDVAQSIAKVIRESYGSAFIIGSDMGERHAGHLFVDVFKVLPAANSKNYIASVASIVEEFEIDILVPTSEPEIEALSKVSELALACKIITPGKKVVQICLDKFKTNKFMKSIGLAVPWTVKSIESLPLGYPCIFKSMTGSGSKLLYKVKDEVEAQYLAAKHDNTIFQELLLPDDSEITCAVFRSRSGLISILQLKRELVGGTTSWAKVIYESEIDRNCRLVAEQLDLTGSMNIQLRLTANGPRIFEINPRFSSTVYMRNLIGFSDVIWSVKDTLNENFTYPEIPLNTELVRIFDSKILVR